MDCALPGGGQVAPGDHFGGGAPSTSGRERRPTGRVVGIIRRNWRPRGYAGSLQPDASGAPRSACATAVTVSCHHRHWAT